VLAKAPRGSGKPIASPGRSWQLPPSLKSPDNAELSPVAKPEWGSKRICLSCGARFYDLQRSPITCPSCGAVLDLEVAGRTRRARPAARAAIPADDVVVEDPELAATSADDAEEADTDTELEDDTDITVTDESEEEDDRLIEDASELGEDDDDVGEVIEGVDDEEESR
jgi:uncharacterized protein (TIGR02300 family)